MLGKKTMEADILKEALDFAHPKKDVAIAVMERSEGRFPMSTVAKIMGVARPNLIKRTSLPSHAELTASLKTSLCLPRRAQFINQRPTYGYRR